MTITFHTYWIAIAITIFFVGIPVIMLANAKDSDIPFIDIFAASMLVIGGLISACAWFLWYIFLR